MQQRRRGTEARLRTGSALDEQQGHVVVDVVTGVLVQQGDQDVQGIPRRGGRVQGRHHAAVEREEVSLPIAGLHPRAKGLMALLYFSPDTEGVIFAVCDQPYITPDLFLEMIATGSKSEKPIIACQYDKVLGTPVLFKKEYFDKLLALKDSEGARQLLQTHPESIEAVPFPLGNFDIDTMQDYTALQNKLM